MGFPLTARSPSALTLWRGGRDMNIEKTKRELRFLAYYAERVLPDDNGNRVICADTAEKAAKDALIAIEALVDLIHQLSVKGA